MNVPDQVLEGMGRTIRGSEGLPVVCSPEHQCLAAQSSSEAKWRVRLGRQMLWEVSAAVRTA